MKKLLVMLCVAALLAISVCAAETVIYENDFSDPYTLFDFQQYRCEWEIRDGHLYMTDRGVDPTASKTDNNCHIVYQSPTPLTNYIIEVDIYNARCSTGLIFNVQQDKVTAKNAGIWGYTFNMSKAADLMAIGSANQKGGWSDNVYKSTATAGLFPGVNLHLTVMVKDGKIGVNAYDIDKQKAVCSKIYKIGDSKADGLFTEGTFGFRALQMYNDEVNSNVMYFDNLKVTTANETDMEALVNTNVKAPTVAVRIDTRDITPIYTNNFDDETSIEEFAQFYGTWKVIDGKLYLADVETAQDSLIIYNGNEELKNLKNYVLDVDMYNIQSQGGAIVRSQVDKIDGTKNGSDFRGYMTYISFDGKMGAIGFSNRSGSWGGNLKVSTAVTQPGMNVHIQTAVKGDVITYYLTEIGTGKILWSHTVADEFWSQGSFGFRLCTKIHESGTDNVMNTYFDNLVISTFPDADKTEIKMTIGSNTAYVNGEAKTLDAAPINRNSRTMLPVRFLAENLGASVAWDDATKTATLTTADTTIAITIGASSMTVNGASVALDSPALIESSRTYLPLRAIANALGVSNDNITWDDATKTATLVK